MAHTHHSVGQPFAVLVGETLPAAILEPTVELLQVVLRQLIQRDVPDLRDDVQADAALIGFLRGGADLTPAHSATALMASQLLSSSGA